MSQLGHCYLLRNMEFMLIFDVPFGKESVKIQTHRTLTKVGARMLRQSVWKSKELSDLMSMQLLLKNLAGMQEF